jgi:hypothetical protein
MAPGGGMKGQTRNPVTVLIISFVCCFYAIWQMWQMLTELQAYTRDEEFKPWYMFIPLLNYYFLWIKVPEQITRAKPDSASARNKPPTFISPTGASICRAAKSLANTNVLS